MRIGYTINLGDYQSLRIETSDLPTMEMCKQEIKAMLSVHSHLQPVQDFILWLGLDNDD